MGNQPNKRRQQQRQQRQRRRRTFSYEFKVETVRLCQAGDRSVAEVARDLDLNVASIRQWIKQIDIDEGNGPIESLTTNERDELTRLRRENRQLQMEREILKKAAAFFAKENT